MEYKDLFVSYQAVGDKGSVSEIKPRIYRAVAQSPPIICHAPTASRREVIRHSWWPKLGEIGKRWISKFSLRNITQILLYIKDYDIWNSFSLTDMRLLPQK